MVDIYRNAKRRGIYLALGTDHEGDICFSIYKNNAIKMHFIFRATIRCKRYFIFSSRASSHFDFRLKIN